MTAAVTSAAFGVPLRHCPDAAIAGVVIVAWTYLDALPDCLAARHSPSQSPEHEVVRLSAWPEPDVAVFKVISGHG